MSWFKRDPERDRYYLLPGMGGRARHRKQKLMLQWSIAIGLLASAIFMFLVYWLNTVWVR